MDIMIAKHTLCSSTQLANEAQGGCRLGAPADQIAGQPEPIAARVKAQSLEQPL